MGGDDGQERWVTGGKTKPLVKEKVARLAVASSTPATTYSVMWSSGCTHKCRRAQPAWGRLGKVVHHTPCNVGAAGTGDRAKGRYGWVCG